VLTQGSNLGIMCSSMKCNIWLISSSQSYVVFMVCVYCFHLRFVVLKVTGKTVFVPLFSGIGG